jgi:hypothetical protein
VRLQSHCQLEIQHQVWDLIQLVGPAKIWEPWLHKRSSNVDRQETR